MPDQGTAIITAIAAIPKIIPIIEEMPILPVALLKRISPAIPNRIALRAKIPVRIIQERRPRIILMMPSQFHWRFGAGTGAGKGTAAATGCWKGTAGDGAG
jgi:hypothetical protein